MTKKSTTILLIVCATFVIAGSIEGYLETKGTYSGQLGILHTIIISILLFIWCKEHATENNLHSTSLTRLFVAVLPIFGVPFYLFKFFGFKKGGVKLAKTIGFSISLILCYSLSYSLLTS